MNLLGLSEKEVLEKRKKIWMEFNFGKRKA
jgi:hypothetical protein